jgi:hypothetical protein
MRWKLSEALTIINCLRALARVFMIEDPCSPDSSGLQGIFDRKEVCRFQTRSLTPQQATGTALAFAVQQNEADGARKMA